MSQSFVHRVATLVICVAASIVIPAGLLGAPTVELNVAGQTHQGLNVAHNDQICWLASKDGSYERVDLSKVTSFRKAGGEFRSSTPAALAGELRKTLGRKFEVLTRGNYVICAPPGQAGMYADLLTRVEKSFNGYFTRRGWPLASSGFPLVIVVHPNKLEFDRVCLQEGLKPSPILKGFYHPQSNRVMLYDQSASVTEANRNGGTAKPAQLDDASQNVAVHEAIHQLAFNSGLHQRIGENPCWLVEGLATMLEAGALDSTVRSDTAGRVNPERMKAFQEYRATRRKGTIADFISNGDQLYNESPIDFYSEAWALTFYLAEARRADYVRYLKKIAERDPLDNTYSPEERLADFQSVFGKDVRWMETQFLRFIDKLE
ncbi:DUF1570 domain-containing protein [Planctomicrobium sp. SH661]|uniref:DUF1570 domain-containing protein n=1 Tax=Planctomicrobium sp. SH661 TaxID=3448124 RepID=UPI003F5C4C81